MLVRRETRRHHDCDSVDIHRRRDRTCSDVDHCGSHHHDSSHQRAETTPATPSPTVPATTPPTVPPPDTAAATVPATAPPDTAATGTTWAAPTAGTVIDPAEALQQFNGYWTGEWGNQLIQVNADGSVVSVYDHDQGILVGTITGGILNGWWCEVPSRKPPDDAGAVQMRIVGDSAGKLSIDGRWQYAYDPAAPWRENWDITTKGGTAPEALTTRLAAAAGQCPQPGFP